jgi:hypothetical protein
LLAAELAAHLAVPEWLHGAARRLGLPGALLGKLAQQLGELLPGHDALIALLGQLLKRGADLMADRGVRRHVMGELMQRRSDLLLLLRGDLLGVSELLAAELLAVALLAEALLAAKARARVAEVWVAKAKAADLRARALQPSIAAHPCAGRPEERGRQSLSEIRGIVSVRHDILHWPSSD